MPQNRQIMWKALELAKKGRGYVSPNPLVGCILFRKGEIVGSGYHAAYGGPHAERIALDEAQEKAWGSWAYITLEPCVHDTPEKHNPPCVQALIEARIDKAFVAMEDPNPLVKGKGIQALQAAGIEVEVGLMAEEAKTLNASYMSLTERKIPHVCAKWAMTLDGKIASFSGHSQWISGEESRFFAHQERGCHDALMVGIGTVLSDDPLLTARAGQGRQPLRVVLDPKLQIPITSQLIKTCKEFPLLIYAGQNAPQTKKSELEECGVEICLLPESSSSHLSWKTLLEDLGKRKKSSLLIEGGAGLLTDAFENRIINQIMVFVAPKIIGGKDALTAIQGKGVAEITQGAQLDGIKTQTLGSDVMISGQLTYP